jgi:3-hydroxyacyl-[acyl-carrier-protein] dehydratase
MPPVALIDPAQIDTSRILYDQDAIRQANPQRFEMEQLTAIVDIDDKARRIVGYKDVRDDEFWVRGHIPDSPLMPGVLICEAAAQLCSFYCHLIHLVEDGFLGFGGLEDVRFRGQVVPGDRLVIVAQALRLNRRQSIFETQGFVGTNLVYHGRVMGVVLNPAAIKVPAVGSGPS